MSENVDGRVEGRRAGREWATAWGWTKAPAIRFYALSSKLMTTNDYMVYDYLHTYANEDREVWHSRKRIATELGLGTRTIDRSIAALEKIGAIRKNGTHQVNGTQWSNAVYIVHDLALTLALNYRPTEETADSETSGKSPEKGTKRSKKGAKAPKKKGKNSTKGGTSPEKRKERVCALPPSADADLMQHFSIQIGRDRAYALALPQKEQGDFVARYAMDRGRSRAEARGLDPDEWEQGFYARFPRVQRCNKPPGWAREIWERGYQGFPASEPTVDFAEGELTVETPEDDCVYGLGKSPLIAMREYISATHGGEYRLGASDNGANGDTDVSQYPQPPVAA